MRTEKLPGFYPGGQSAGRGKIEGAPPVELTEEEQFWVPEYERAKKELGTKEPPASIGGSETAGDIGIADIVFLAFMHTGDDAQHLADMLYNSGKAEYEERIRQELLKLNCTDEGVYLREEGELSWLRAHCDQAAVGITGTYNRDLRNAIDRIISDWQDAHDGSLKGLNRSVLAKQVIAWDADRTIWKAIQVSTTEMGVVDDRAVLQFAELNSTGGRVRVVPEDAVCNICQSYVAMGWVPLSRASALFSLPVHPGCPHVLTAELEGVPDCQDLWRGGSLKGWGRGAEWQGKEAAEKGGQGSGNFGHAGRPGEVGGSALTGGATIGQVVGPKSAELPIDIGAAVSGYVGSGFHDVNSALRHDTKMDDYTARLLDGMDKFVQTSIVTGGDIVVLRGIGYQGKYENSTKGVIVKFRGLVGNDIIDKGFVSTTKDPQVANVFGAQAYRDGEVKLISRITLHEGSRVGFTGKDEQEYVLARGSKFHVIGVVTEKYIRHPTWSDKDIDGTIVYVDMERI